MSDSESSSNPSQTSEPSPKTAKTSSSGSAPSWIGRARWFAQRFVSHPPGTAGHPLRLASLLGLILVVAVVVWFRARAYGTWSWILAHPAPMPALLVVVGLLVISLLWKLPERQAKRSQGLTADNRFDRENEARKTLAQIIAGVFVLAGLYSSVQTFTLQREGQITDRYTKAIEQLGAVDKLEVRLGGIYALERIAHDSERDHWPIIEVLTAYVRENSPTKGISAQTIGKQASFGNRTPLPENPTNAPHLRADIQAILTVIGRRVVDYDRFQLDLGGADLSGANLFRADLSRTDLSGANLSGAMLLFANLRGAHLGHARFRGADLREADLSRADLSGADLRGADLFEAKLSGVYLRGVANLTQLQLNGTRGFSGKDGGEP
jgi:hypothetical protein